ncbi:hypothetical protein B0H21DRAFT_756596 [Amylocystis lapponica]|nr:hypothetical protein B0H21DRAFT_756596 [Amylocystis lapponica]
MSGNLDCGLPPELTDRIIDHLRGDQGALYNCALTCRAWLPRSRYNLFRAMEIRSLAALTSLVALSHDHRFLPYFRALRELCLCDRPTISVSYSCSNPHQPFGDFVVKKRSPFMPLVPPLLARFMSGISVLCLEAVEWHMCQLDPTSLWFSSRSFEELKRLLCALPSLSELVLHSVQWPVGIFPNLQDPHIAAPPRLTSLDIRDCPRRESNALIEWLLLDPTIHIHSLRHLRLKDSGFDSALIQRIALSFGPFLETLEFNWSNFSRAILQLPIVDEQSCLTSCTSLLSFHLTSTRSHDLSTLAGLLSHSQSKVLRHIKLDIATVVDTERILHKQLRWWRQIDKALTHERFAHLETVVIIWRFRDPVCSDATTYALAKPSRQFPRLRARGVLEFTLKSSHDTVAYHCRR